MPAISPASASSTARSMASSVAGALAGSGWPACTGARRRTGSTGSAVAKTCAGVGGPIELAHRHVEPELAGERGEPRGIVEHEERPVALRGASTRPSG